MKEIDNNLLTFIFFLEGELDLREFVNLKILKIREKFLETYPTKIDVSNCSKLTDLYISAHLFQENKIIGLEKTSIIRLDCRQGDLLYKSEDSQFIWNVFIRKYNTAFPEMKLINIDDLTEIARQVNSETIEDEEFLSKLGGEWFVNWALSMIESGKKHYYLVLDQLSNSILARCLIIQNRLYSDKDEITEISKASSFFDGGMPSKKGKNKEYEAYLIELSQSLLKCNLMNPKYPEASLYSNRERLVNQAINGDTELLKRLQDLPYLNPKYKLNS